MESAFRGTLTGACKAENLDGIVNQHPIISEVGCDDWSSELKISRTPTIGS
jgi:hypothetical protein